MGFSVCSTRSLVFFFLISAIPVAYIISEELAKPAIHVYHYHTPSYLCETAKWDNVGRRFLLSFLDGGVGQVSVPDDYTAGTVLEEVKVINEVDVSGNSTMGIVINRHRNRLVVAFSDLFGFKYSAIAASDLSTWKRLFFTQLSGPSDEKSLADDIAIDEEGNSYITDVIGNKSWKIRVNGEFLSTLRSPLFSAKEWYRNLLGLNGIVHHPDGIASDRDGLLLLSPTKLVVAGNPSTKLLESSDGWATASIVAKFKAAAHRVATAPTLKDGKVYLSHTLGIGFPKKNHVLVEAVF